MFERFYAEGTEAGLDLDIELELSKRVYCFIGRNGAGKTVLLETLGRALLLAHAMFDIVHLDKPLQKYAGLISHAGLTELHSLRLNVPRELHLANLKLKTASQPWTVTDLKTWATSSPSGPSGGRFFGLDQPLVVIGARDRGFVENLSSNRVQLLGSHDSRFLQAFLRTYQAVTRQRVDVESLADWLVARLVVHPAFAGTDDRSFEVETILRLMEELDPFEFRGLATRSPEGFLGAIRYSDGNLWLGRTPIDKLPSGFVSIIKLFQEILGGYAGWTAFQDEKDLANLDGIVLIDEIEAHLHPMWQARILPLLKRFFPRTTFFVCTHSPLIVASTEEGEAYELVRADRRVTARKLGNPRAWYLADVYEQAFHVELPTSDNGVNVPDLLLDFSIKVKEHLRTKEPALKQEAEALYERLAPSVPPTDPRRASLDALKDMLR
jgi:energy-coupling factor transporter ATP-binding protein EcfA2